MAQGPDQNVPDEATLIRRLKKGDFEAFDVLFEKHRRGLFAYVRTIVNNRAMAEDIVQECFVKLVEKIDTIRPSAGVSGWLYRVARNASIDSNRRGRFEVLTDRPGEFQAMPEPAHAVSPADTLAEEEDRIAVEKAVSQLPEELRNVIALHFFGGLKFREVAGVLHRPLGTVLWQGQRALEELKGLMNGYSPDHDVAGSKERWRK